MSGPWMKFYPSDWRADPALRMCSLGARGLWAEMMCIMHEAEPYGCLLVNGQTIGEKQLASLVGTSVREVARFLGELSNSGVFSVDENLVIYSRRMKRDREKAERDKANGKSGGNPSLKAGVNPPDNGGDKAQNPEPRTQSQKATTGSFGILAGEGVKRRKTPPHGAAGNGRVWISAASTDWEIFAEDYFRAHGEYPKPEADRHGRWFKILGEQARDPPPRMRASG